MLGRLLRRLRRPAWRPDVVHRYGPHPDQFLELALPAGGRTPAPVAVVLHGGFWRAAYGVELARPLAADLAAAGWAAVAVEYRRVGAGGGWPATLEDVAAALDALPDLPVADRLDLSDLTVVGHSAGGHLAAWAAGRARLPAGAPGAAPRVRVGTAVLQAGVLDLADADRAELGGGAVRAFLGAGAEDSPDRLASADPLRLLPTGARVLCVHGAQDDVVPVRQSERYAEAARAAGDAVDLRIVPGDHMVLIEPEERPWRLVRDWLVPSHPRAAGGHTLGGVTETSTRGWLSRKLQRLTADDQALDAQELRADSVSAGCEPLNTCRKGKVVTVTGRLKSVVYTPRETVPTLEAELFDGSGSVTLVWLGRRRIPGIEPGRTLTARGRFADSEGKRLIYNPWYELGAG